jgi:hypothetical protein
MKRDVHCIPRNHIENKAPREEKDVAWPAVSEYNTMPDNEHRSTRKRYHTN